MGRKHSSHPPPPRKNGTFLSKQKKTGFLTFQKTSWFSYGFVPQDHANSCTACRDVTLKAGVTHLMNRLQSQATISPRKCSICQEDQRKQQTWAQKSLVYPTEKAFANQLPRNVFQKNRHACRAVIPAEWSTTYGQLHHYYCCYITDTMILFLRGEGRGAKSKLRLQLRGICTHDTSPNHHCQKNQTSGVTDTKEFNYSSYLSCVWNK